MDSTKQTQNHDAHLMLGNALPSAILDLDLSRLKVRPTSAPQGELTNEQWDAAETEYRRYLTLLYFYPGKSLVPSQEADMIWRLHILDTAAYRKACDSIFGQFIDYTPSQGWKCSSDEESARQLHEDTVILYEKHFGSHPANP